MTRRSIIPKSPEWVAGVMSVMGELKIPHKGTPRVQYLLASVKHPQAIREVALFFGVKPILMSGRETLRMSGKELDKALDRVWEHLTEERKREYNGLVEIQTARMGQLKDQRVQKLRDRKYWEGKVPPTNAQRRQRLEADYHNQDPAVQVIEDEDIAGMQQEQEAQKGILRRKLEHERDRAAMPWIDYREK